MPNDKWLFESQGGLLQYQTQRIRANSTMILDALLIFGIAFLIIQGAVLVVYDTLRASVLREAQSGLMGHPGTLYLDAVLNATFIWIMVVILIMATACLYFIPLLFMAGYGFYFWYKFAETLKRDRAEKQAILSQFPAPNLQFQIQDLWIGAGTYGLLMMVLAGFAFKPNETADNVCLAIVVIVVEVNAFLIAMDVCRHSGSLKSFWPRAGCIVAVMGVAAIPPMIIIEVMAWKAWSYALWKSRVPKPLPPLREKQGG